MAVPKRQSEWLFREDFQGDWDWGLAGACQDPGRGAGQSNQFACGTLHFRNKKRKPLCMHLEETVTRTFCTGYRDTTGRAKVINVRAALATTRATSSRSWRSGTSLQTVDRDASCQFSRRKSGEANHRLSQYPSIHNRNNWKLCFSKIICYLSYLKF